MEIGILTTSFRQPTLEATAESIHSHGLGAIQLGLGNAGLETLPSALQASTVAEIRRALDARAIKVAALSGYYNMIDPDLEKRRDGMRKLGVLAAAASGFGTSTITICTGTRNPDSMWRPHRDNDTTGAWRDLVAAMAEAAALAESHQVTLAFEPEVSNVVDSARKARRLIDEIGSPRLKVCFDGANLFHTGELPRMREILDEAFDLLGSDIVLAHAKDLDHDGAAGHLAAGYGVLDYDRYVELLRRVGYSGALILHGLNEDQIDSCVAFLRAKLHSS